MAQQFRAEVAQQFRAEMAQQAEQSRGGSAGRSEHWLLFQSGLGLNSSTHGTSQVFVTPVPEDPTSPSDLHGQYAYT